MSPTTKRTLIIALTALLIAGAGFAFLTYHVRMKEAVLQTQLNTLSEEMRREDSFNKLKRLAEESKTDREQLRALFVTKESDSIDVLSWIESTAPQAGVHLETKGLQKVTDEKTKTDWVEASFALSGERAQVERFVAILERLPYLSHVTDLSLTARSSTNWEALVTLRVYLYQ